MRVIPPPLRIEFGIGIRHEADRGTGIVQKSGLLDCRRFADHPGAGVDLIGGLGGIVLCLRGVPHAGVPGTYCWEIVRIRVRARRLPQLPPVLFQRVEWIRRADIHIETIGRQIGLARIDQAADRIVGLQAGYHRAGCSLVGHGGRQRGSRSQLPEPEFTDDGVGNGRLVGEGQGALAIGITCGGQRDRSAAAAGCAGQAALFDQQVPLLIGAGRSDRFDPSVAILIPPGKPECVTLLRIKSGGLNRHRLFVK